MPFFIFNIQNIQASFLIYLTLKILKKVAFQKVIFYKIDII